MVGFGIDGGGVVLWMDTLNGVGGGFRKEKENREVEEVASSPTKMS